MKFWWETRLEITYLIIKNIGKYVIKKNKKNIFVQDAFKVLYIERKFGSSDQHYEKNMSLSLFLTWKVLRLTQKYEFNLNINQLCKLSIWAPAIIYFISTHNRLMLTLNFFSMKSCKFNSVFIFVVAVHTPYIFVSKFLRFVWCYLFR